MISLFQWNVYLGPALLVLGVLAQCLYALRPQTPFQLALAGAGLVLVCAFHDLDSTLLLGQLFILPLLWFWGKKS